MLPTHRPPTHPGEMLLKEFLEPLGVSQVEAADRMNIAFQRLNAIVKGRRAVSADTALLLEALTGWDAQIWPSCTDNYLGGSFIHWSSAPSWRTE
jgi:antitoxin HigA-1